MKILEIFFLLCISQCDSDSDNKLANKYIYIPTVRCGKIRMVATVWEKSIKYLADYPYMSTKGSRKVNKSTDHMAPDIPLFHFNNLINLPHVRHKMHPAKYRCDSANLNISGALLVRRQIVVIAFIFNWYFVAFFSFVPFDILLSGFRFTFVKSRFVIK